MTIIPVLVLMLSAMAQSLTPDAFDLEVARYMEEVEGSEVAEAWIEARLELEVDMVYSADVIAFGLILDARDSQNIKVPTLSSDAAIPFRGQKVRMAVEGYVRGDCGDTLAFAEVGLPITSSMVRLPQETRYESGEQVVLLLRGTCAGPGEFRSSGRSCKYIVEDGIVTCKALEIEEFLEELRGLNREEAAPDIGGALSN